MKTIIRSIILISLGLLVGYLASTHYHEKNQRKLNEWFYIEKATSSFMSLYAIQQPSKFGEYHEKDLIFALRSVEQLTNPKNQKEKIDLKETLTSITDMGISPLIKATDSGLDNIDFSSEEKRLEVMELIQKIKSNQAGDDNSE